MFFIADDELDNFRYATGFVWSSIYIEDWDYSGEFFGRKLI